MISFVGFYRQCQEPLVLLFYGSKDGCSIRKPLHYNVSVCDGSYRTSGSVFGYLGVNLSLSLSTVENKAKEFSVLDLDKWYSSVSMELEPWADGVGNTGKMHADGLGLRHFKPVFVGPRLNVI